MMFWQRGRGTQMSQGSIVDSTGKALEHRTVDNMEGEELETFIATAPLDLSSGFGGKSTSREADSPLDLSTKTRKIHADSTENREIYPFHPGNFTTLRKVPVSLGPASYSHGSPFLRPGSLEETQSNVTIDALHRRRQLSPHISQHVSSHASSKVSTHASPHLSESVNRTSTMYKPSHHLGQIAMPASRQWAETERQVAPPRPDSVRNATAAGYIHSRNKLAASSDEQYYAMIKSIQQRQAAENRYKSLSAGMSNRTSVAPVSNINYPVRHKQEHSVMSSNMVRQKQLFQREASSTSLQDSRGRVYPSLPKPNYLDITQRCSPDSTISPGHVIHPEHQSRAVPSQGNVYAGQSLGNLAQGNMYQSTQNVVPHYSKDFQKVPYPGRPLHYSASVEGAAKSETFIGDYMYNKQGRSKQSSSFTSHGTHTPSHGTHTPSHGTHVPSHGTHAPSHGTHAASVVYPNMPQMQQRSLIRGTSGKSHSQPIPSTSMRKPASQTPAEQALVDRGRQYSQGHHRIQDNSNVIKSPLLSSVISNKQQLTKLMSESRNVTQSVVAPDNRTNVQKLPSYPQSNLQRVSSSTESSKNYPENVKSTPQVQSFVRLEPKEEDNRSPLSSPLAISIPSSLEKVKSNEPPRENKETRPRPFSKKQIIMSAFNRDEGLKSMINNAEAQKASVYASPAVKPSTHNVSHACPESPKMPTLSPQQKMPLQSASGTSLQGTDPPTLDIASKQESFLAKKAYFQDKRPRLLSSLPRKTEPMDIEEDENDDDEAEDNETVTHESSSLFSRPVVHYKKIPIANVAPMVHGSISTGKVVKNNSNTGVNLGETQGKQESYEKAVSDLPSNITPVTTIQTVNSTMIERRNSSMFPPQRSIFSLERKSVEEAYSKAEVVVDDKPCIPAPTDTGPGVNPAKEMGLPLPGEIKEAADPKCDGADPKCDGGDKHQTPSPTPPTENPTPKQEVTKQKKSESPEKEQKLQKQEKAKQLFKKARLKNQQRFQTKKNIRGSRKRIIKCKAKEENKNKGFIDFKPEVLVSRTRTQAAGMRQTFGFDRKKKQRRRQERSHRDLRQKVRNLVKGTRVKSKIAGLPNKIETPTGESSDTKNVEEAELQTDKNSTESHEVDIGANTLTNEVGAAENPKGKLLDDGTWEIGGTSSTLKQTLRNGKSKGGIMMKLLFRPKKRVRRRSSTQRIGKSKRRSRFRKNRNLLQKTKYYYKQGYQMVEQPGDPNRLEGHHPDDDVFVAEDNVGCDDLDPSVDCDYGYQTEQAVPFSSPEVKKLVVCKDTGETILHRAARLGHLDVVVYCLTTGSVAVSAKDNAGYTPLHESCVSGHIEIVRLLLCNGAEVNCASQDGIRPIHDAVENDHPEIVRLLIAFGADPTLATYGGVTPIKISHSDAMLELLTGCLSDINGATSEELQNAKPWQFDILYDGNGIPETNVFADLPVDPEEERQEDYIHESDQVQFPVVKLPNVTKEILQSCVLLSDISEYEYFKNSKSSVRDICKRHSIEMLKCDVMNQPELALYYSRFKVIPSDKCHLVYLRDCNQIYENCQKKLSVPYHRKSEKSDDGKLLMVKDGIDVQGQEQDCITQVQKIIEKEMKAVSLGIDVDTPQVKPKRKYRKRVCTPDRLNTSKYSNVTPDRLNTSKYSNVTETVTSDSSGNLHEKKSSSPLDKSSDISQGEKDTGVKKVQTQSLKGKTYSKKPDQTTGEGGKKRQYKKRKSQKDSTEKTMDKNYWEKFKDLKLESEETKHVPSTGESCDKKEDHEQRSQKGVEQKDQILPSSSKQCLHLQRSDTTYKRKLDFSANIGQPQVKLKRESGLGAASSQARRYENEFWEFLSRGGKDGSSNGAKNNGK